MVNRVWADLPSEDKDPDPSTKTLLCVLFREWGRRDPLAGFAALRKLSHEWPMVSEFGVVTPGDPLCHAIWAGYGEIDPAGAWERLSGTTTVEGMGWIFADDNSPEMHAVLDSIFAQLLVESPVRAAEAAESDHEFRHVAMRHLLANMDDAKERLAQYHRWIPEIMKEAIIDPYSEHFVPRLVPSALTGIAMRDPEQAWQLLPESDEAFSFFSMWVRIQPEQAIPFLEQELGALDRKELQFQVGLILFSNHPDLAVEWVIRAKQKDTDPLPLPSLTSDHTSWPVVEEMKPGIPLEEWQDRIRKALDDQSASDAMRAMICPLLEATD